MNYVQKLEELKLKRQKTKKELMQPFFRDQTR